MHLGEGLTGVFDEPNVAGRLINLKHSDSLALRLECDLMADRTHRPANQDRARTDSTQAKVIVGNEFDVTCGQCGTDALITLCRLKVNDDDIEPGILKALDLGQQRHNICGRPSTTATSGAASTTSHATTSLESGPALRGAAATAFARRSAIELAVAPSAASVVASTSWRAEPKPRPRSSPARTRAARLRSRTHPAGSASIASISPSSSSEASAMEPA